jgi:hypothetical protein
MASFRQVMILSTTTALNSLGSGYQENNERKRERDKSIEEQAFNLSVR